MELFALNRNCRNGWIIVAAVGDILAAFIGMIGGAYKFKKVHERMMPVCAPAAAAPASSYGGGVVVGGGGEKYDCFAGYGVVVALGAAITLNVIAHVCIIVVAGSCCHCGDGDGDHNSETKTHRNWTIFFEFMTWLMLVIGCVFLGMGVPRLEKKPSSIAKVCTNYNTTAAYYDGRPRPETNVCSAAWIPAVGGVVVAVHAVFGFLYAPFARKLSRAGGSGRSSN